MKSKIVYMQYFLHIHSPCRQKDEQGKTKNIKLKGTEDTHICMSRFFLNGEKMPIVKMETTRKKNIS